MKFIVTIRKEGASDEMREIEGENRFAIYTIVNKEGGTVIGIREAPTSALNAFSLRLGTLFSSRIKKIEIARMTRNLATMITAGLSLARALSVVERESENARLKTVAAELAKTVEKGSTFHEALAAHSAMFPQLLVAMVRVGEESGTLSDSLNIVGLQMEHSEELTQKVKGALIYPCIIIVAILVVSILMMIYVVPTLTQTFTDLKVELPFATKVFVAISNFLVAHLFIVLGGLVALAVSLVAFVRSTRGHALVIAGGLRLPVIGELIQETFAARTARTLSSLLTAGVPVLESISITREVVQARLFASVLEEAEERVKKGEALSLAFADHPKIYPLLLSEMLAVGEETGKVADLLKQAAEFYEEDVSQKTKDLSTVVEPVLMLLVGAVVGIFAVSMIAPIYSLSSAI